MPFFVIFGVLLVAVVVTVVRVYTEPFKADVTLVVGGWNLLNLVLAGCALGVVSERGERAATRRVKVSRRCEFRLGEKWLKATIEDVSANGMRVQLAGQNLPPHGIDTDAEVRFTTFFSGEKCALPLTVRNVSDEGSATFIGCRFLPATPLHHKLIADLLFANSDQWSKFQISRRGNPGVLRGTIWFFGLAFFQTYRGMVYLFRGMRKARPEAIQGRSARATG